ncbi:MAG: hypothetical protein MPJ52_03675, partial [Alphaproteobacteria bacterium]|nr:hypothetical protein [Alphaproteobacteria bacterium]
MTSQPALCSSAALTEESTPPLIATTTLPRVAVGVADAFVIVDENGAAVAVSVIDENGADIDGEVDDEVAAVVVAIDSEGAAV